MYSFQIVGQEEFHFFGFLVYVTVSSGNCQVAMVLNADGTDGLRWVGGKYLTYDTVALDEAYVIVNDIFADVYAEQQLTIERIADVRRSSPDVDYLIRI